MVAWKIRFTQRSRNEQPYKMLFYTIIFLSIFIPYVAPKGEKEIALFLSSVILFIPWGLQYEVTQDWEPHLAHWNVANGVGVQYLLQRDQEPIYKFILNLFAPFGFFSFLIFSALAHISVLFLLIKKNLTPEYYWGGVAVLMLSLENGLLIINSNRQSWALVLTIIGTLTLYGKIRLFTSRFNEKHSILVIIIGLSFYIMAMFIHGGAVTALLLIPIFFLSRKVRRIDRIFIFLFYFLFFIRFIIDASPFQRIANLIYASTGLDNFDKYIEEMEMEDHLSTIYNILFFVFMNLIIITFKYMSPFYRFASLAFMVKILFSPYMTGNIQRILQYFWIYSIVVIPYCFKLISDNKKQLKYLYTYRYPIVFLSLLLIIYDFVKIVSTSYMYERWPNFKTIFDAPRWM